MRYKWPFGISATVLYLSGRRTNTATPTGNYDPRCLPVRVLFLLLFFSLPLLALAKASHPTNKYVRSRKTVLKGTICPGGADEFFFWRPIGRDLAGSQGCSRENRLVSGETTSLARSCRKTWSVACNAVLHKN